MTYLTDLKAAAERATQGEWTCVADWPEWLRRDENRRIYPEKGDALAVYVSRENGAYIALASPARILPLIEALEEAERKLELISGQAEPGWFGEADAHPSDAAKIAREALAKLKALSQ